jgi:DNA/RNA-binding domain of Phe-tRNA-synthetase-like protein
MEFLISPDILIKYPQLSVGVIIAEGLDNSGESKEIQKETEKVETGIRNNFSNETLSQNTKIEVWRKAYTSFGAKPKDNKCSVESLYRTVLNGNHLRHINMAVDIYNLISLKYMLPVGGEDIDKVQGNIELTFAKHNESPVLLLGDKDSRSPHEGEVIYKDEISAICRRWNWREADRTKLTENTKNAIIAIENLIPSENQSLTGALEEMKRLLESYCHAKCKTKILAGSNYSINLKD